MEAGSGDGRKKGAKGQIKRLFNRKARGGTSTVVCSCRSPF